jgi:hypothetical protein
MRRLILFGVVLPLVAALGVFAATMPERDVSTFPVEPGTERTFPGEQLVAGDRFTCHGVVVLERPPHSNGFAAVSSDGLSTGTSVDGTVTIRCPTDLSEI